MTLDPEIGLKGCGGPNLHDEQVVRVYQWDKEKN